MKVKRYVGETAQEAMQKVKSDLGRDAIILNTRKIRRKGIAGIFSKPLVEVVATIDTDINHRVAPKSVSSVQAAQSKHQEEYDAPSFINELQSNLRQGMQQSTYSGGKAVNLAADEEIIFRQPKPTPVEIKPVSSSKELGENVTPNQIGEIKNMLNKVYDAVKPDYESSKLSDISKKLLTQLEKNEVERVIINDLKEDIMEQLTVEEQQNEKLVRSTVYHILNKYIKDPQPYAVNKNNKVIIFIGPTGVGKTTTLAKLAANMVLNEKKKVGLITSDTYRIAAVEQLKTYSEIIGVPLSIIYSPSEISKAIRNYDDKDIILVDTAGRSHKDQYQLMELKSLLKSNIDFEIYLAISATTKFTDCVEIIKSYSFLDDYKLLFTKLDETSSVGILLNVAYVTKKPICYITTGQSVPDDIEIADKEKIINSLMGDNQYERSS
jgi:flagellar biosynthesis protein FlhF